MKANSATQLDLIGGSATDDNGDQDRALLVVELDHRTWMRFLSEEWLFPDDTGRVLLGLGRAYGAPIAADLMTVGIWFDQARLPASDVMAWRGETWLPVSLNDLVPADTVISWDGPLPLFAVHHFTVEESQTKAHLLAMASNFADIAPPAQAFEVCSVDKIPAPLGAVPSVGVNVPPQNWDARRGAASMAMATVPAIGPWLDLLCGALSSEKSKELADIVHAPWLRFSFWTDEAHLSEELPSLWRAMVAEFSRPGLVKEWKPRLILESVCARARSFGESEERLTCLIDSTTMLLQDRGTVESVGLKDDILGLVFQLLLLRPSPERFATWKEDWPSIPPGAWWSGAILSGYISGFRALPIRFRGSDNVRKFLALRSWELSGGGARNWSDFYQGPMTWGVNADFVVLRIGNQVLDERKFGNRGRWYQLDLNNTEHQVEATAFAEMFCPDQLRQVLILDEGDFKFSGGGRVKVDVKKQILSIEEKLEIPLNNKVAIVSRLDRAAFRDWLATASMPDRLPRPVVSSHTKHLVGFDRQKSEAIRGSELKKRAVVKGTAKQVHTSLIAPPDGLVIIPDFISQAEESVLLKTIDAMVWDDSMSRRVQHYGWRYDYKNRKVNPKDYLGLLPNWAEMLGEKLVEQGYLSERPDQVIVNEYVGQQGIAKHIDCPSCFRGAVVTVSLNESWEMVFSRRIKTGDEEKYKALLVRRSAAVLDGEARSSWQHEIPRKRTEGGLARGRRVSITLRKVDIKS
jgi:alkylated DNA repair dioxygenase AlkB